MILPSVLSLFLCFASSAFIQASRVYTSDVKSGLDKIKSVIKPKYNFAFLFYYTSSFLSHFLPTGNYSFFFLSNIGLLFFFFFNIALSFSRSLFLPFISTSSLFIQLISSLFKTFQVSAFHWGKIYCLRSYYIMA